MTTFKFPFKKIFNIVASFIIVWAGLAIALGLTILMAKAITVYSVFIWNLWL